MLDLKLGTPSQKQGTIVCGLPKELSKGEVDLLDLPRGIKSAPLKELRESHHNLARLLAQGLKEVEVASITGFSQSRISILKADPSFKELLAHYGSQKDSAFADILGQMKALSADALAEVRARLEDSAEDISTPQLLQLLALVLDRTGHGAMQKVQATNISISGEELLRVKTLLQESGTTKEPEHGG